MKVKELLFLMKNFIFFYLTSAQKTLINMIYISTLEPVLFFTIIETIFLPILFLIAFSFLNSLRLLNKPLAYLSTF